jgi:DNA (cytosine-5)-methyltransferase 1
VRTHLDIFSGIGGFAIAAQNCGYETVAFCEKDKYAQQILKERFGAVLADATELQRNGCEHHAGSDSEKRGQVSESGNGSRPRLHPDIFTLNGADYAGVDLLTGGFPCQPFSVAGKRRGAEDERALWPEMLRVIDGAKPAWLIGENVAGIVTMELDNILSDLEGIGYAAWPLVIPACAVDARHRRDRVWIVAHATRELQHGRGQSRNGSGQHSDGGENVADADSSGQRQGDEEDAERASKQPDSGGFQQSHVSDADCEGSQGQLHPGGDDTEGRQKPDGWASAGSGISCGWKPESQWFAESGMGRVAHGIPHRTHRLRGLGNAIVPQVAFEIIRAITNLK